MSYCRLGWDGNELYMFEHVDGFIECSACKFDDPWILGLHSLDETLEHVAKHRAAGHVVPEALEDEIRADNPWNEAP